MATVARPKPLYGYGVPSLYRLFDGLRYRRSEESRIGYTTESDADRKARSLRANGYRVRLVRAFGAWWIYYR